jgi:hypothetical protein
MGYEITCRESSFKVLKPKSALAALKAAHRQAPFFEDFEEVPEGIDGATTLAAALAACDWDVERDADGKIDRLFYEGKLLTNFADVERLFQVLAPFVRTGSFLIVEGEDGDAWRFTFSKGRLRVLANPAG